MSEAPFSLLTHEVANQPPPLEGINWFEQDRVLLDAVAREGGAWGKDRLSNFGAWLGQAATIRLGEQANRYPVDLILTDQRPSTLSHAKLLEKDVWRSLPAVQANQVGAWPWKTYSHLSYTKALKELTATITAARPDVV